MPWGKVRGGLSHQRDLLSPSPTYTEEVFFPLFPPPPLPALLCPIYSLSHPPIVPQLRLTRLHRIKLSLSPTCYWGFGSKVTKPLRYRLRDRGFDSHLEASHCESNKFRGFSPGTLVSSRRESWLGGWGGMVSRQLAYAVVATLLLWRN